MRREPGWVIPICALLVVCILAVGVFALREYSKGSGPKPNETTDSDKGTTDPDESEPPVSQTTVTTEDPLLTAPPPESTTPGTPAIDTAPPPETKPQWTTYPTLAEPNAWYATPSVTPEPSEKDPEHVAVIKRPGCVENRAFNDFYRAGIPCTIVYENSTEYAYGRLISVEMDGYEDEDYYYVRLGTAVVLHVSNAAGEDHIADYNDKVFYLTFDDGPNGRTDDLAAILAKYNVKASFFLIGENLGSYPSQVQLLYEQGHAIGCHSFSHEYYDIYATPEALLSEIARWEEKFYRALGGLPALRLFRFPGGSNNSYLSKNQLADFVDAIHGVGYRAFDWTCQNSDTWDAGRKPDQTVDDYLRQQLKKTLGWLEGGDQPRICLMHEISRPTYDQMEWAINYIIDQGYTFRTLNDLPGEMYL